MMNSEPSGICQAAAADAGGAPALPRSTSATRRSMPLGSPVVIHVPTCPAAAPLPAATTAGPSLLRPPPAPTTTTVAVSLPTIGSDSDLPLFSLLSCATSCASSVTDTFVGNLAMSPVAALHRPGPQPVRRTTGDRSASPGSGGTASPTMTTTTNPTANEDICSPPNAPIAFHKEGLMFEYDPAEFRRRAAENMRKRREDFARQQQQQGKQSPPQSTQQPLVTIPSPPRVSLPLEKPMAQQPRRCSSPPSLSESTPSTSTAAHAPPPPPPPLDGEGTVTTFRTATRDGAAAQVSCNTEVAAIVGRQAQSQSATESLRNIRQGPPAPPCDVPTTSNRGTSAVVAAAALATAHVGVAVTAQPQPSPPSFRSPSPPSLNVGRSEPHHRGEQVRLIDSLPVKTEPVRVGPRHPQHIESGCTSSSSSSSTVLVDERASRSNSGNNAVAQVTVPFSRPRSSFASDAEFVEDALRTFCVDDRVVIDWNTRRWSYKTDKK